MKNMDTSGEHPNAARIRALFAAFKAADLATIQTTIPEQAVWHFPGRKGKLADDTHAVAFFRGHGTREGKSLDNPTCLRLRLENGQVMEVWEFVWDLFAVDEFWA